MRLTLPVLLAARLGEVHGIVAGAHDDRQLTAVADKRRQVDGERRVAALMTAGQATVAPDGRLVVDGAKVQQQPVAGSSDGAATRAAVPARPEEAGLVDAARAASPGRTEPRSDGSTTTCARLAPASVWIEREIPLPVQRLPSGTIQLRTRIAAFADTTEHQGSL